MDDKVEASGKTVDEAVEQALLELGLSKDEVDVEVLSAGSRGRFGLGGEPARVVVSARAAPPARAPRRSAKKAASDEDAEEPAAAVFEEEESTEEGENGEPVYDPEAVARAEEILRELLRLIDIEGTVESRPPETPGD